MARCRTSGTAKQTGPRATSFVGAASVRGAFPARRVQPSRGPRVATSCRLVAVCGGGEWRPTFRGKGEDGTFLEEGQLSVVYPQSLFPVTTVGCHRSGISIRFPALHPLCEGNQSMAFPNLETPRFSWSVRRSTYASNPCSSAQPRRVVSCIGFIWKRHTEDAAPNAAWNQFPLLCLAAQADAPSVQLRHPACQRGCSGCCYSQPGRLGSCDGGVRKRRRGEASTREDLVLVLELVVFGSR